MTEELKKCLGIRYTRITFTVLFPEGCILPRNKVSALRGGMGEMLLRANCIRDRNCEQCDFEPECIVQRTMYSKFEEKPAYITKGDSIGYVMECENYQEEFEAGETMQFHLMLFGKTIVYFNQYLQALFSLGMQGIGKYQARFQIIGVTNEKKQPILDGRNIHMKYYQVSRVADYVEYRMQVIKPQMMENRIVFKTPLTLKYQGGFLQEFQMEAIANAIRRRIYMLDCFEGINGSHLYEAELPLPDIISQEHRFISVRRYSNRQNDAMLLRGIEGTVLFEEVDEKFLPLLLAGELVHIGKNTSFGFGRYRVR